MEQINLNLIPNGILAVCHVSQYDNTGRKIRFHLFNGSDTYALSGTETITLRIRKTNGEILTFDVSNTASDYIDLTVLQQMTDVSGVSICEFRLTDSGLDIGSFNFKMKVEPDAFDGNLSISEVSGPIATFETDLAEDLIKLDVDLKPIQDLHGYDHPWPAGGGKNIYPLIASDTKNGITLTNDNGVITLNGTATADTYFDIDNLNIPLPTGSKLYLCAFNPVADTARLTLFLITNNMGNPQVNLNSANAMLETTITSDGAVGTRLRLRVPNGFTYSNYKLSPYLQIGGSTPTLFTPYSNICPISGHTEAKIVHTGKNLAAIKTQGRTNAGVTYTVNDGHSISLSGTATATSYAFPVITNTDQLNFIKAGTYTLKGGISSLIQVYIGGKYVDGTSITRDSLVSGDIYDVGNGATMTFPKDCYIYIQVKVTSGTATDVTIYPQLELGSEVTNYKPYTGTEVTVQLGQEVYGGTIDLTSGVLRVDTCYMAFDGTQEIGLVNWRPLNNSVGWLYRPNITPNIKNYVVDESNLPYCKLKSNKLQTVVYGGAQGLYGKDSPCISLVGTEYWAIGMRVNDTSLTSATAINNWLSQNPIEVIYELETPIEIPLSAISPIPALVGTNNVYSDAGDVEVEYYTTFEGGND